MAPECLREGGCNTTASDVYSFGVVVYEVSAVCLPARETRGRAEDHRDCYREYSSGCVTVRKGLCGTHAGGPYYSYRKSLF